jgi:hypothetical protein
MKSPLFFPILFFVGFENVYNKTGQVRIKVTLSSLPVTTVAVKNAKLLHILSVCR